MEWIYKDNSICVCIKPSGVLSTDEPGGMPDLVRQAMGVPDACVRTVHRLDRVVSGLMLMALTPQAASDLSRQIREGAFDKAYLAVVHGSVAPQTDTLRDLMYRDKARRMSFVTDKPDKGVQEAVLDYRCTGQAQGKSRVYIQLHTGRTHQIRVQFASRGWPLVGERKYSTREDPCAIALWSHELSFVHPDTGERLHFSAQPPETWPWSLFPTDG